MKEVVQPYISVDINPATVQGLIDTLASELNTLGVAAERSTQDLHVSLAYVLESCNEEKLKSLAAKIAVQKLEAKVCGVEILEGQTTGYDYVVLSFEAENRFAGASQEISKQLTTKRFSEGFKSHLTLFRLKKGGLQKEQIQQVCACLSSKCDQSTVAAKSVCVFNSRFEKEFSVAM